MLEPVKGPREHGSLLVPDDLLVMLEADPKQTAEHLAREFRGVPHIGSLEAGDQSECVGPVRTRIAGDRRLGVTKRALFHVRGLGRAAAVQSRPIAPFRIELNAVRWVG